MKLRQGLNHAHGNQLAETVNGNSVTYSDDRQTGHDRLKLISTLR